MWFNKIKTDLAYLPDMVDYFENELIAAHKETKISGSLEKNSQELPAQVSWRFMQLQEIEAVLKHLNILYDKKRSEHYRRYLERYNRELSDRSIEKYIDGEQDVVDLAQLINEVALVRNNRDVTSVLAEVGKLGWDETLTRNLVQQQWQLV